ncbi:hypothetical protein GGE65_006249 [Skermanella aerolata]|uniref:hypothetical protein n=1 Tax=Skermanella aerolata TaxID=393310 RepID=UPI003D1E871B
MSASNQQATGSRTVIRPRGRPRNDGQPPGTVGQIVFVSPVTGEIVPRPKGRPSKVFLSSHHHVSVPPGRDPEEYLQEHPVSPPAPKPGAELPPRVKSAARKAAAVAKIAETADPNDPGEPLAPENPKPVRPLTGAALKSKQDAERRRAEAADMARPQAAPQLVRPVVPKTEPAPPQSTLREAADTMGEQARLSPLTQAALQFQGERPANDALVAFLRIRLAEVTRQRDESEMERLREKQHFQAEYDRLQTEFEKLFESAEQDRRALREELRLSMGRTVGVAS